MGAVSGVGAVIWFCRLIRFLQVPYCCFNGGMDVFVDLGSKQQGIEALQQFVAAEAHETVHFGDQFSRTGRKHRWNV